MKRKRANLSKPEGRIKKKISAQIAIVVSEWNQGITAKLLKGATDTLKKYGIADSRIFVHYVPGSFELPLAAKWLADKKKIDAVICLGCVIQGQTRHFDFICSAVAEGIMEVGLQSGKPIVFGVLTVESIKQARDRTGGSHGNKGVEAALTALRMVELTSELKIK